MKGRIDKLLASNGLGSRRDIKRLLKSRVFTVNGETVTDPSVIVDFEADSFTLEGKAFRSRTFAYLMLNKPAGVVTSTADPNHGTVLDLLDAPWSRMSLHPVGRLDRDTEGLLLLTNDGPLTHRLTSPKTGVDKTYRAVLRDPVDAATFGDYRARFAAGVTFHDGYTTLPARLFAAAPVPRDSPAAADADPAFPLTEAFLTIQEGKYHQVKKMFLTVGNEVTNLSRLSMGPLVLDPALASGEWRELTEGEIAALRRAVLDGDPQD